MQTTLLISWCLFVIYKQLSWSLSLTIAPLSKNNVYLLGSLSNISFFCKHLSLSNGVSVFFANSSVVSFHKYCPLGKKLYLSGCLCNKSKKNSTCRVVCLCVHIDPFAKKALFILCALSVTLASFPNISPYQLVSLSSLQTAQLVSFHSYCPLCRKVYLSGGLFNNSFICK